MRIIPAVLAFSISELERKISVLERFATEAQIDIMDGVFVGNTTVQLGEIVALPQRIIYEAHLMVQDPVLVMPEVVRLGISRVALHVESDNIAQAIERYRHRGIKVFLAINPATSIDKISPWHNQIDGILVMTVVPGFGGQDLMLEALDKVRALKSLYPDKAVEVDGGVNFATLGSVAISGADAAVVGSAILGADDPELAYRNMQNA